jgi:hypothetical protein
MLLEQISPYSPEVTLQSQVGIYGRSAAAGEDQVAFAYPPFSLLALGPTLWMPFDWAYAAWLAFNVVGLLSLLFFLFRPANRLLSLTAILFYPVFICLVTGNFSVLMAGAVLLFFGLAAARDSRAPTIQVATALLLAWAAAKPQFIWIFTLFILLFALKQRLHLFLGAYFGGLLALLALSFALVPNWVAEWLARVAQYAGYVRSRPVLSELLGLFLPERAALLVTGAVFVVCAGLTVHLFRRWWKGELDWPAALGWVGLVTYLFHLHGIAYEQLAFLAPLLLWVGLRERGTFRAGLVFWFGSLILSWLAFAAGMAIPAGAIGLAADRAPVLFNALWAGWLLRHRAGRPSALPGIK